MSGTAVDLQSALEERIRLTLPGLDPVELEDVARSVARLVEAFQPEEVHVFGSHARGDSNADSDVDLMVVVSHSDEPSYRRAQHAFHVVGSHRVPLDILVRTREEFEQYRTNPASFHATILREGHVLYAP